ncbi:MAG: hypothetical protein M0Z31_03935 [Clostridia bacterium]|nr:hypothetical protein [Clostridia bacterium]
MSYDLYFCRRQNDPLTKEELIDYFNNCPHYQVLEGEQGDLQFWYENEDTEVYFSFDFCISNEEQENTVPEGFYDTGLSFNINFLRPTFFALEAMPLIEETAKKFDLLVIDPQDHEIGGNSWPKECKADELVTTWEKSNVFAIERINSQGEDLLHMPKEKSLLLWNYLKEKNTFQDKLGDEVFVPQIFLIQREGEKDLHRVITWTQAIPQIFPECEYIIVLIEKRRFGLKNKAEEGIIPYHLVISQIEQYLEPIDGPIPNLKILKPQKAAEVVDIFNGFKIDDYDDFLRVGLDNFIDIKI